MGGVSVSCLLPQTDPMPTNKMTALTVHLPFVGFTYTNNSKISDNPPSLQEGSADSAPASEGVDSAQLRDTNTKLHAEVENLKKQLTGSPPGKGSDGECSVCCSRLLGQSVLIRGMASFQ